MKRRTVHGIATAIGIAVISGGVATVVRPVAAQDVPAISGVWKLNAEASTNPNGPPPKPPARGQRGSGEGDQAGGSLGQEEMKRFNAMKAMFFQAPEMMGLKATAVEFAMLLDPEKKLGYAHKTDNKKRSIVTPSGPADFKVRWDGRKIVRDIETPDTLHVVEEYELSGDGKQLVVTVKANSRMVFNVQTGDIRRVYDRQQ